MRAAGSGRGPLLRRLPSSPRAELRHPYSTTAIGISTAVAAAVGYLAKKGYDNLRRIPNVQAIPPAYIEGQREIRGVVTNVRDPDNFRLYHTPWPYSFWPIPLNTKDRLGKTIHVRIAGADAPELGRFGKPPQAYAKEAQEWLKSQILDKVVFCTFHRVDHYDRVVATVYYRPTTDSPAVRNLSLEMVRHGWARVYTQHGAVYGVEGIGQYLEAEREAK
ncbi:hypothetical protein BOTBODRAFT_115148 [Botryobasidium botryosum FD-172 SS1]|uniref:TNase-like domain-containing protein n=1 Tax=Botryobasidium botryosum (strain FD-172 SS1) TaxID=930990 RepID=A0A067M875_BOTB1|nr:hypothetical protein BOTBODRAFT_115148 [Botryobasidium botryosum FD-172 SS1]